VTESAGDITRLLGEVRNGRSGAESELAALVYRELHKIAERLMRSERADHTLQPTALVNEAYVRLLAGCDVEWQNRAHFLGVAANVMRRILVDYARARGTEKRGGNVLHGDIEIWNPSTESNCEELIIVDEALTRLAQWDPRQSRIVELRFFVGLSDDEIAEVLRISSRTVRREWKIARAWLYSELAVSARGAEQSNG
jgi:RNA polymerase sigma-70 factor, ECF subfamily